LGRSGWLSGVQLLPPAAVMLMLLSLTLPVLSTVPIQDSSAPAAAENAASTARRAQTAASVAIRQEAGAVIRGKVTTAQF